MILSYHEIRNLSPEKTREIVIRAINGPLHDLPKKPHSSPNKTPPSLENLITLKAKRTGFSYRRLKALILRKYSLSISENTIKKSSLIKILFLLMCIIIWLSLIYLSMNGILLMLKQEQDSLLTLLLSLWFCGGELIM
ncbi:hypothetical protein DICTH_0559 [Dictyoglomus thermophilum H-6-12]|uniref:Uncharacterized protein n=1 Tax=Dictyoglomus thermophilum (strain ATCC 35947 / DSM 3960 / H-6-12) TaxID=309799 RepID=B5YD33_DICT6|nr:hypothetical protein DICTH_0559 [Dictyoglomus thermophilum H-6-12]